ncbi:hypothetical protein CUN67_24975 (plasmid) [Pantoea cypripedii]|uniref:Uncharacterized protein n=1 Tax=Pantoea cypripedii TaxID=55209 RepID=A0A6B9GDF2_PANCY|nr:hypothetical protein CUN67_24975 [Pantoea cypripedii]
MIICACIQIQRKATDLYTSILTRHHSVNDFVRITILYPHFFTSFNIDDSKKTGPENMFSLFRDNRNTGQNNVIARLSFIPSPCLFVFKNAIHPG